MFSHSQTNFQQLNGYKCTALTNSNTPFRLSLSGNIECFSVNGKNCSTNFKKDVECRQHLNRNYGKALPIGCNKTRYQQKGSWCQKGKEFFFGKWHEPSETHLNHAFRIEKDFTIQCLSLNGKTCAKKDIATKVLKKMKDCTFNKGKSSLKAALFTDLNKVKKISCDINKDLMTPKDTQCKRAFAFFRYTDEWLSKEATGLKENIATRISKHGDIECLSEDGRTCTTVRNQKEAMQRFLEISNDSVLKPVTCGASLQKKEKTSGYSTSTHWCHKNGKKLYKSLKKLPHSTIIAVNEIKLNFTPKWLKKLQTMMGDKSNIKEIIKIAISKNMRDEKQRNSKELKKLLESNDPLRANKASDKIKRKCPQLPNPCEGKPQIKKPDHKKSDLDKLRDKMKKAKKNNKNDAKHTVNFCKMMKNGGIKTQASFSKWMESQVKSGKAMKDERTYQKIMKTCRGNGKDKIPSRTGKTQKKNPSGWKGSDGKGNKGKGKGKGKDKKKTKKKTTKKIKKIPYHKKARKLMEIIKSPTKYDKTKSGLDNARKLTKQNVKDHKKHGSVFEKVKQAITHPSQKNYEAAKQALADANKKIKKIVKKNKVIEKKNKEKNLPKDAKELIKKIDNPSKNDKNGKNDKKIKKKVNKIIKHGKKDEVEKDIKDAIKTKDKKTKEKAKDKIKENLNSDKKKKKEKKDKKDKKKEKKEKKKNQPGPVKRLHDKIDNPTKNDKNGKTKKQIKKDIKTIINDTKDQINTYGKIKKAIKTGKKNDKKNAKNAIKENMNRKTKDKAKKIKKKNKQKKKKEKVLTTPMKRLLHKIRNPSKNDKEGKNDNDIKKDIAKVSPKKKQEDVFKKIKNAIKTQKSNDIKIAEDSLKKNTNIKTKKKIMKNKKKEEKKKKKEKKSKKLPPKKNHIDPVKKIIKKIEKPTKHDKSEKGKKELDNDLNDAKTKNKHDVKKKIIKAQDSGKHQDKKDAKKAVIDNTPGAKKIEKINKKIDKAKTPNWFTQIKTILNSKSSQPKVPKIVAKKIINLVNKKKQKKSDPLTDEQKKYLQKLMDKNNNKKNRKKILDKITNLVKEVKKAKENKKKVINIIIKEKAKKKAKEDKKKIVKEKNEDKSPKWFKDLKNFLQKDCSRSKKGRNKVKSILRKQNANGVLSKDKWNKMDRKIKNGTIMHNPSEFKRMVDDIIKGTKSLKGIIRFRKNKKFEPKWFKDIKKKISKSCGKNCRKSIQDSLKHNTFMNNNKKAEIDAIIKSGKNKSKKVQKDIMETIRKNSKKFSKSDDKKPCKKDLFKDLTKMINDKTVKNSDLNSIRDYLKKHMKVDEEKWEKIKKIIKDGKSDKKETVEKIKRHIREPKERKHKYKYEYIRRSLKNSKTKHHRSSNRRHHGRSNTKHHGRSNRKNSEIQLKRRPPSF